MKQAVRYFSLGILISTLLLFGYHFFIDEGFGTSSPSEDELITLVEAEGYHVISEQEYISFTLHQEEKEEADKVAKTDKKQEEQNAKDDEAKKEQDSDKKDSDKDKEIKKASFKVKEGMFTPDIADILIENKIIDNKKKFVKYMDGNGYSDYLQLGTFKINSEMTLKEIAETLTTYPGN